MATTPYNVWRFYGGTAGPGLDGWVPLFDFGDYLPLTGGTLSGSLSMSGTLTASRLISNVAVGTAPLTVTSTTMVANLTAQFLGAVNQDAAYLLNAANLTGTINTGRLAGAYTGITSIGTQTTAVTAPNFVSNVATGTPPLTVTSQTVVPNLNADKVDGIEGTDMVRLSLTTNQTLSGALTINGGVATTGYSNLVLGTLGVIHAAGQGGQMTLKGDTTYPDWHLDVYQDDLRILRGSLVGASFDDNGMMTLHGADSGQVTNLMIEPNLGASNRAAIQTGDWQFGQDYAQTGVTNDFFMWHTTVGKIFGFGTNGDFYLEKAMVMGNSQVIWAKDSGGTNRAAVYPRFSDNAMYLDGGSAINLRTNDGQTTVMVIGSDGYARTRGQRIIHGACGNTTVTFDSSGFGYVAHGLGFTPASVVASPASTLDTGVGVSTLTVNGFDATYISFKAIRTDNGSYVVSPRTLAVRWIACFF